MIIEYVNFFLGLFLCVINFIMFHALISRKKLRSKEENLFLEKSFFTGIFFLYHICIAFAIGIELCENDRDKNIYYRIQEYIFNVYIVIIYLINLFITLEMFYTYKNPIYYFHYIFNQKTRKSYEMIIIIIMIAVASFNYFDPLKEKNKIFKEYYINFYTPFILLDRWKWIILFLINIITLFYNFKFCFFISKFEFNKRNKLKKVLAKKIVLNFFYFIYNAYNLLTFDYLTKKVKIFSYGYKTQVFIGSYIFLAAIMIDTIIELSIISTTKFALYKLRHSLVGLFGCLFSSDFGNLLDDTSFDDSLIMSEIDFEMPNEEIDYKEIENEISLAPKCAEDAELISIYKNNIYFEDYFLNFFDQYLNILMASLFKMYNSKLFSINALKNEKLKEEIGITESAIGIINNCSTTAEISETRNIKGNCSTYYFRKKINKDPFILFKDILGPNSDDLKVKISTYYTNECVLNISNSNLISKKIASSFVSHFIINKKKENEENPNNFASLTAANSKEEYFKNIKNFSLKSYDKNFNIDFFETEDDEIIPNNIIDMIIKYFNYVQKGKGQTGTFLPLLIGIFKVKINNFKTILIFISRNTLVQNVPKKFFNYWQLVRFSREKPKKIASSKFTRRTIVKDDPLFERLSSKDLIQQNPELNKILLKNYYDFKETISNDIVFLKNNHLSYVNLLMMYYEYENTQKHEQDGAIKIRKTDANEAEIICVDNPQKAINEEEGGEQDNINNDDKNKNLINDNIEDDDVFGDEVFDFTPESGKIYDNLLDYSEKVNINAYEGSFDDFICMCFFSFENVFDTRSKFNITTQPYTLFEKKIVEYFEEFKLKD